MIQPLLLPSFNDAILGDPAFALFLQCQWYKEQPTMDYMCKIVNIFFTTEAIVLFNYFS